MLPLVVVSAPLSAMAPVVAPAAVIVPQQPVPQQVPSLPQASVHNTPAPAQSQIVQPQQAAPVPAAQTPPPPSQEVGIVYAVKEPEKFVQKLEEFKAQAPAVEILIRETAKGGPIPYEKINEVVAQIPPDHRRNFMDVISRDTDVQIKKPEHQERPVHDTGRGPNHDTHRADHREAPRPSTNDWSVPNRPDSAPKNGGPGFGGGGGDGPIERKRPISPEIINDGDRGPFRRPEKPPITPEFKKRCEGPCPVGCGGCSKAFNGIAANIKEPRRNDSFYKPPTIG